jgi:pyruvate formate lyase activating enzyme
MLSGLVSNIQKFSLHDGPGIRTTVFLKGCPLACAWCHNPENISRQPEVIVYETRCVRCGECVRVCPQSTAPATAAPDCQLCGACVEACPTGARTLLGRQMTIDELLAEILKDRVFYEESGGGVTFSGGEPLVQYEFLQAALKACRTQAHPYDPGHLRLRSGRTSAGHRPAR